MLGCVNCRLQAAIEPAIPHVQRQRSSTRVQPDQLEARRPGQAIAFGVRDVIEVGRIVDQDGVTHFDDIRLVSIQRTWLKL